MRSRLLELTGGRGPDKCIDAVGMEATHGSAHIAAYDRVKQAVRSETERPHALRQAIMSCRSGGVVSVIGVYGGLLDKFPAGAWMNRSLTLRTGQCHVQRYMKPLLQRIERGEIDPDPDHHPHPAARRGANAASRSSRTSRTTARRSSSSPDSHGACPGVADDRPGAEDRAGAGDRSRTRSRHRRPRRDAARPARTGRRAAHAGASRAARRPGRPGRALGGPLRGGAQVAPRRDGGADALLDDVARRREECGWDVAVCLTDLPLHAQRVPLVAHCSARRRVGVVSLPALGLGQLRAGRTAVAGLVEGLLAADERSGRPIS